MSDKYMFDVAQTHDSNIISYLQWVLSLYRFGHKSGTACEGRGCYQQTLEHVVQGFSADSGSLAFLTPDGQGLELVAGIDLPSGVIGSVVSVTGSRMGTVILSGEPLLLNDDKTSESSEKNPQGSREDRRVSSAMCWPLRCDEGVIGALNINRGTKSRAFTETDLEAGRVLIDLISVVLENSRLHRDYKTQIDQLERMNDEIKSVNRKLEDAQNQLLQSEKMASVGQLAAGVAHEINNPVGYVSANLSSLHNYLKQMFDVLKEYEDISEISDLTSTARERLENVRQEADLEFLKQDLIDLVKESQEGVTRVTQIVQDLKDFSHVDEAEWQWADLHKNLDSTLNIAQNEIKYKAEVVKKYADIPRVECMPSQINQVCMNLLVNAAHAIEDRGVITLRTGCKDEDWVWLEVSDNGKGISSENVKRIFDPFFTTKPVGSGTGLGLSLSYGIVQSHGGCIEVDSEIGKGSVFRVWLPRRQTAEPESV